MFSRRKPNVVFWSSRYGNVNCFVTDVRILKTTTYRPHISCRWSQLSITFRWAWTEWTVSNRMIFIMMEIREQMQSFPRRAGFLFFIYFAFFVLPNNAFDSSILLLRIEVSFPRSVEWRLESIPVDWTEWTWNRLDTTNFLLSNIFSSKLGSTSRIWFIVRMSLFPHIVALFWAHGNSLLRSISGVF